MDERYTIGFKELESVDYLIQPTYYYYFKRRFRQGPCPYLYDQGNEYEYKCNIDHFRFCGSLLKMNFEEGTGKLIYLDFLSG